MIPEWGEMTRNQPGRIEGRSVRIFAEISRIPVDLQEPPDVAFGCEGETADRRGLNVREPAKMTPEWGKMARDQAGRIEGRSVRIFAIISRIPADRQDPHKRRLLGCEGEAAGRRG